MILIFIDFQAKISDSIMYSVFVFVISFIVLMTIYGIYVHYYIKTYYYEDNGDFLTIRKGPITPAEINVQYAKIQDVYIDQDLLDRIFGIYDVHISSATYSSGIEAHIDGVNKNSAEALKNLFLQKIKGGTSNAQASNQFNVNTSSTEKPIINNVTFSRPISSDEFGLSSNWWVGEFVKAAFASVLIPGLFTFLIWSKIETLSLQFTFLLWVSILIIYTLYRLIFLYLWKTHYKYNFGPEYIYIKTGIISISEKNMGYNSIQDVGIRQTLIDRIFGVADLIIENASGATMPAGRNGQRIAMNGINIEGLSLADAQSVSDELKKVIINKRDSFNKGL
jgi:putative membrane protein